MRNVWVASSNNGNLKNAIMTDVLILITTCFLKIARG